MKPGRASTMPHEHKRNGTATLFAALSMLDGSVIGECLPRQRDQEFLKFLRTLDRELRAELDVHMILDNYGTHTHDTVKEWLAKHPRFHLHFVSTPCSWLNLIARWFREIPDEGIRRGVFTPCQIWSPRSNATSTPTTKTRSRSSGPPRSTRSSRR